MASDSLCQHLSSIYYVSSTLQNTIKWYLVWSFQQPGEAGIFPRPEEKTKFNKAKNPTWGHKAMKSQSLDSKESDQPSH